MVHSMSLGARERLVSYGVGLGVGIGLPILLAATFALAFDNLYPFLLPVPFALLVLLLSRLRPVAISVDDGSLEIHRPIGPISKSLVGLKNINHPPVPPGSTNIGLVASHGFFGVFGLFWNREWGTYGIFVTDSNNRVELFWEDGSRIIVSPDDPSRFVASLRGLVFEQ